MRYWFITVTWLISSFLLYWPAHLSASDNLPEVDRPASTVTFAVPAGPQHKDPYSQRNSFEFFVHGFAFVPTNDFADRRLFLSGGALSYHLTDSLFVEGWLDYFTRDPESLDDLSALSFVLAFFTNVGEEIPTISKEVFVAGGGLGITPISGNLRVIGAYIPAADFSFSGGFARLGVDKVHYRVTGFDEYGAATLENVPSQTEKVSYNAGYLGISARLFLTRWMTLRADARLYTYVEGGMVDYANPQVESGAVVYPTSSIICLGQLFAIGLSGFVPLP